MARIRACPRRRLPLLMASRRLNGQFGFGVQVRCPLPCTVKHVCAYEGAQAFRAAAREMHVFSRCDGQLVHAMRMSRKQVAGIAAPTLLTEAQLDQKDVVAAATQAGVFDHGCSETDCGRPLLGQTGTTVVLGPFDALWWRGMGVSRAHCRQEPQGPTLPPRPRPSWRRFSVTSNRFCFGAELEYPPCQPISFTPAGTQAWPRSDGQRN